MAPSIVNPLVRELHNVSESCDTNQRNPVTWTNNLIRILHLETFSTATNASPLIESQQTKHTLSLAVLLLETGAERRALLATNSTVPQPERDQLLRDVKAMRSLIEYIEAGEGPARCRWDGLLTLIVGKKAMFSAVDEPWMEARHALED